MSEDHAILRPKFAGQRRMLALDGGGIRGILTIGMLEHLEARLAGALGAGENFRICDYFDFIGGTSTGAILAAGLAVGKSVADLRAFYETSGALMFEKQALHRRLWSTYKSDPLREKLREVLGGDTELGSAAVKTLLLIMTKNVTTDSPWPFTNNPLAKYNARDRDDCNLMMPLWQLVRASTAAPVYFPPEVVELGERQFVFIDGGVTPYNNPAFTLFRTATATPFRLEWETGEDRMLLLSFGTGSRARLGPSADDPNRNLFEIGVNIASEMMNGMAYDQDINCRAVGRCVFGAVLDREVGDLVVPAAEKTNRRFTYARYDLALDREGLDALGFPGLDPTLMSKLDAVGAMDGLLALGREYGKRNVDPEAQYPAFLKR